jgi:hypothetical protein
MDPVGHGHAAVVNRDADRAPAVVQDEIGREIPKGCAHGRRVEGKAAGDAKRLQVHALTKQQAEVLAAGPAHTQADQPIHVGKGCATVVIVEVLAAQFR